jgi:predicted CXXCH cytochrome family protein
VKALALIVLVAVGVVAVGHWAGWRASAVEQPIQFPHKTHVDMNLACMSCHERAEKDAVAGRPPTELCLGCHSGSDKSEEKKIQMFGANGGEIPWKRIWRLPPYVFFSHRTHVAVAKVQCQSCHGAMETLQRPPAQPLKKLTMNDCLGCHEQWQRPADGAKAQRAGAVQKVTTDCAACHR